MARGGARKGAGRKKKLPDLTDGTIVGRGAPTLYKPEFIGQARKLCELGATDVDLADFFSVNVATIYRWAVRHNEFCEALKSGKAACDHRVVRSLYHRAVGYTFDSEKVFQFQGQIIRTPIKEHVPPDTAAAMFWLKNRQKENWRDVNRQEHSGPDGEPIQTVIVLPSNGR